MTRFFASPLALGAAIIALALTAGTQAQVTCPSGVELQNNLLSLTCERLRACTHAEVAIRIAHSQTRKGAGADMFRALEKYRYCSQGRGSWTEQQWMDKCTQQGWKVAALITPAQRAEWAIPNGVDLNTTKHCWAHKTKSQYRLYSDGNGFVYEQQHCTQDQDNDGSYEVPEGKYLQLTGYETRVSGSPNCDPIGPNPTDTPKWVEPWD